MAAAQASRPPREVVDFPLNVPVTVALKYSQGKTISSQYGERFMFSLIDGRVMFLDPEVAGQIASLGINVRESFSITKQSDGSKDTFVAWKVSRLAGEHPNGTFVVPALPVAATVTHHDAESTSPTASPKPPALATAATANGRIWQPGTALVEEAYALVDAYAQVLERTLTTYQGRVKPDEARALLITAYIQRSKLSSVA
jgi:hypothetical protein